MEKLNADASDYYTVIFFILLFNLRQFVINYIRQLHMILRDVKRKEWSRTSPVRFLIILILQFLIFSIADTFLERFLFTHCK